MIYLIPQLVKRVQALPENDTQREILMPISMSRLRLSSCFFRARAASSRSSSAVILERREKSLPARRL